MLNSYILCCTFCACKCACTVVVRSPGGGGGPSLRDSPSGGGGGPSSLGGEGQGGGGLLQWKRSQNTGCQVTMRSALNINVPMQRVMKLRNLPPLQPPATGGHGLRDNMQGAPALAHTQKWDSLLDVGALVDRLWEFWTWLAEETGLALSCDGLITHTVTPILCAPSQ